MKSPLRKPKQKPVVTKRKSSDQLQLGERLINLELSKGPQFSELLCNQFVSRVHWITATCSLVTVFYWWTKPEQLSWYLRIILSFTCNLMLHLFISGIYNSNNYDSLNNQQQQILTDEEKKNKKESLDLNADVTSKDDIELGDELLKESRTIKHKEWVNRLLNEIWPRICSNCKMDEQEGGIPIGRFLFLNRFNLTKTQTPTIEKINLVNRLDTTNGQVIIIDLIVQIDWSTIDNENLVSLSIYNLQFTISNLHSISSKFRLRVALHYLNKELNNNLYKINLTLLDQPVILNYETSGAAYLLCFFNLHLAFIYWLIENFLIFPHTLVFILNKHIFNLDELIEKLKNGKLIDLDLDDLKSLLMVFDSGNFFDELTKENNEQVMDFHISNRASGPFSRIVQDKRKKLSFRVFSKEKFTEKGRKRGISGQAIYQIDNRSIKDHNLDNRSIKDHFSDKRSVKEYNLIPQKQGHEAEKSKLLRNMIVQNLLNKIAKYILHISVMHSVNVPLPKGLNTLNSLSYYVRIKFGNFKFLTNSHISQEPVLYWMQSFMLAVCKLNSPVYLAILFDQSLLSESDSGKRETKKVLPNNPLHDAPSYVYAITADASAKKTQQEQPANNEQYKTQSRSKLRECFEIKLTDNLELFLMTHNLNGRLYTVEDEHSKCRLTVRFSVFNLQIPNYKIQNMLNEAALREHFSTTGLPAGVVSLYISHVTGIEFISDVNKQSLEQYCRLGVRSASQTHVFKSLNVGNEQNFKQNCFLIIFNPSVERIHFKLYFTAGKSRVGTAKELLETSQQPGKKDDEAQPKAQMLANLSTTFQANQQAAATVNHFEEGSEMESSRSKDTYSLASCDLYLNIKRLRPRYEKIKLNGCLKESYLHLYHCYSGITNHQLIERIIFDTDQQTQQTYNSAKNQMHI